MITIILDSKIEEPFSSSLVNASSLTKSSFFESIFGR